MVGRVPASVSRAIEAAAAAFDEAAGRAGKLEAALDPETVGVALALTPDDSRKLSFVPLESLISISTSSKRVSGAIFCVDALVFVAAVAVSRRCPWGGGKDGGTSRRPLVLVFILRQSNDGYNYVCTD